MKAINRILLAVLAMMAAVFVAARLVPLPEEPFKIRYSRVWLYRDGTPMRMTLSPDGYWRFHTPLEKIPPLLRESVLAFEDRWFYRHPGVNPFAVVRAAAANLRGHRVGASTITMQLARMAEPKARTVPHKIQEMFRALQLEARYGKDALLEMYFNRAPYGGNIEGVAAAARFYFGKRLDELTVSEIAVLTTIPKNPNRNRPDRQRDLAKKRDAVLERMLGHGLITREQYRRARKEPIASVRRPAAAEAVQFTRRLSRTQAEENTFVATSLDRPLQRYLQRLLRHEAARWNAAGIHNAAAVVIDNRDMRIRAYVGSNDFSDKRHGGENDGVAMKKSPGSTLKPFVYALAFDEGLITPRRKLLDVPLSFGGYTPRNYGRLHYGLVPAAEALKLSLNTPVVDLQAQLGGRSLYELLERAGVGLPHPKPYYGLAVAVGGVDISLLELTRLYTVLANGGLLKRPPEPPRRLFSEGAAWLVTSILAGNYRHRLDGVREASPHRSRFAFKTGTSADAKHLYTVGYTREYTVGIWFGNFDGEAPAGEVSGLTVVTDVLENVFDRLAETVEPLHLPERPGSIVEKEVCTAYASVEKCAEAFRTEDLVISGAPSRCMALDAGKIGHLVTLGEVPSAKTLLEEPCYTSLRDAPPKILSPARGEVFRFSRLVPPRFRIVRTACRSAAEEEAVELYLDGRAVGNDAFVPVGEGRHELRCFDRDGRGTAVRFEVKLEN